MCKIDNTSQSKFLICYYEHKKASIFHLRPDVSQTLQFIAIPMNVKRTTQHLSNSLLSVRREYSWMSECLECKIMKYFMHPREQSAIYSLILISQTSNEKIPYSCNDQKGACASVCSPLFFIYPVFIRHFLTVAVEESCKLYVVHTISEAQQMFPFKKPNMRL